MKTTIILLISVWAVLSISAQNLSTAELKDFHKREQQKQGPDKFLTSKFNHNILNQQFVSAAEVLDSVYFWEWERTLSEWQLSVRIVYNTDVNGIITGYVYSEWIGDHWEYLTLASYTFDANYNLINTSAQIWDGINWINSLQLIFVYDGNNNITSLLSLSWNGTEWANANQLVNTYDSNNNRLTQISQFWTGTDWMNGSRFLYTYDADNREILQVYQNWIDEWVTNSQVISLYDANGDPDESITQRWELDHWVDQIRTLYDYDSNHNLIFVKSQVTGPLNWVDVEQTFYEYDANNNITGLLFQSYLNSEWVNVGRYIDTYNSNQNRLTEIYQVWEDEWINQDSVYYYYSEVSGIKDLLTGENFTLFPNPARNFLNIRFDENQLEEYTLEIYSNSGVKVLETNGGSAYDKPVNISRLTPGTYHVLIHHSKGISIQRFIKM